MGSTSANRLLSYRLFVEHLLDSDQPIVTRVLAMARNRPENHTLLADYFLETADASLPCSLLLKDIDHTRIKYRSLKTTIDALETTQLSPVNHLPVILKPNSPTPLTRLSPRRHPHISTELNKPAALDFSNGLSQAVTRLEPNCNA